MKIASQGQPIIYKRYQLEWQNDGRFHVLSSNARKDNHFVTFINNLCNFFHNWNCHASNRWICTGSEASMTRKHLGVVAHITEKVP